MAVSCGPFERLPWAPGDEAQRRPRRWRRGLGAVVLATVVLSLFVVGVRLGAGPHQIASPLVGRPAPGFALPRLDQDGEVRSASLRGSAYIVNFWASWCVACQRENRELKSVYAGWRERDVEVVGVSFDDSAAAARAFRRHYGGDWPLVSDPSGTLSIDFGVTSVPSTFVVSADGTVLAKLIGAFEPTAIESLLGLTEPPAGASGPG